MNKFSSIMELEELRDHIGEVIGEIENGDYDTEGDLSYQVGLAHLQDHLVRAWHFSKLTDEEIGRIKQEGFEKITLSIPKLNGDAKLVEPDEKIT